MNFYKTSLYSGVYSIINLITGLVITKITAHYLGPSGTAYIGKFANITGMILVIATASISVGLIKYISEFKDQPTQLQKLINTAFGMILLGTVAGSILVFISYPYLTHWIFNDINFSAVFILFGSLLILISGQVLVTGLLNGLGEIKKLAFVNSMAAILNMVFTSYFVYRFELSGALFSNSMYGILVTVSGFIVLKKSSYLRRDWFQFRIDKNLSMKLIRFGLFAALTSLSWMTTMMLIREQVEAKLDTQSAGLWQAMFSLSERYLTVISNIMMVYFIPKLSATKESADLIHEMRKAFTRIGIAMMVICLGIWFFRHLIIMIFLADSFKPMEQLFGYQMIGDFFKTCAGLLSLLIASKAMFRTGLKADLSFHCILLVCSTYGIHRFGLEGANAAYALACLLYFLIYLYLFRHLVILIKKSVLPKAWF